jgi:hypothetical protein
MAKSIRITSRPEGGAPVEIRDKWVGLVLPVDSESNDVLLADVRTHQKVNRVGGYEVRWEDAMQALDDESRAWWEENVFGFSVLIFQPSCCEEVVPLRVSCSLSTKYL